MDYRPQSPDLSTYAPQSPNLAGYRPPSPSLGHYAPQSPDLSGLPSPRFQQHFNPHQQQQRLQQHAAFANGSLAYASPISLPQQQFYNQHPPTSAYQQPVMAVQPSIKSQGEDDGYLPDAPAATTKKAGKRKAGAAAASHAAGEPLRDPTNGIQLRTSFPVARIKRIMQADEDIGKVAQVTPHVVSRALELFMIQLVSASARQAQQSGSQGKGPRKVMVQHMKKAILEEERFDFLQEIVQKVPDAPTKKSAKEEPNGDHEVSTPTKGRKKGGGRKKKTSGDDS